VVLRGQDEVKVGDGLVEASEKGIEVVR